MTRVACIGTGFIAGRHLAALAGVDDVEVVAVADPVLERAERAVAGTGARAHADARALLEAEELDAVWLCVPPFAHGPVEELVAERRLPLFVEKPLGLDLASAVRLDRLLRERGVLTAVGYHWRALSIVAQARGLLAERPAQLVTGTWLDSTPAAPWWSRRDGSGGQLVEQTTHLVDLARHLVGEVESVQALETAARPGADVPAASAVLLRFRSGAVGTVSSSCVLDRRTQVGLRLVLDGCALEVSERALSDHELRVARKDGEEVVQTDEDPIAVEDRAFLAAVRGEGEVLVPYADALRTHAVVCAADASAQAGGERVDVDAFLLAAGQA